jgi:hypothetical protein
MRTSSGDSSGDGDGSETCATKYGALCGSGEMSIMSTPGDEEGMGGVATSTSAGGVSSRPCTCQLEVVGQAGSANGNGTQHSPASSRVLKRSAVNRDLRGVRACGLHEQ